VYELPELLDADDVRPEVHAALAAWLAVQARFAFDPMAATTALGEDSDPAALLDRVGERPLAGPRLERVLAALRRSGSRALCWSSPAYPPRLARLVDAPPLLLVRGDPGALRDRAVAVVGARAATVYGREVARSIGAALGGAGRVVVSGLARGIDACAHRAALEAGGRSVAILGCGPDRVYPPEHRRLAAELAGQGALASEFPPGTPPRGAHFPLRNRLISALVEAVVVVEARQRSGSLVTARLALDQGVDVFAVPGPISAATSRGTNGLLGDGAEPVLGVADLLARLGCEAAPGSLAPASPAPGADRAPEAAILSALREQPLTRDELARRLRCASAELAEPLLALELAGCVAEDRDGRLRSLVAISPLRGTRLC